jgi:hypothetical protein
VAHGTEQDIAGRLNEHLAAGADHVAVQVLGAQDEQSLLAALRELAPALGLTPAN